MRIVVIAPQEPAAFFDLLWQGVWEATFDIAQFGVEVANVTPPRHDVEAQRFDDLIGRHAARGVPVVTFHSDAPRSGRTLFVGPDAFHSGVLAGELLSKLMGRVGRVLTFPGPRHAYHLAQRYDGLRREVERHPSLNEVVACIDSDLAAGVVELIRHAGPIDGIYVGSEQIVEVAKALVECELRIPCVGFTNSEEVEPFVKSGVVSAIVDESRFQQGYFAVQKAYEAAAKRGAPAPPGIRIPCSVAT